MDLEVNLVTIGLPGGSGTSEKRGKKYKKLLLDKPKASSFSSLQVYGEGKCNVGVT